MASFFHLSKENSLKNREFKVMRRVKFFIFIACLQVVLGGKDARAMKMIFDTIHPISPNLIQNKAYTSSLIWKSIQFKKTPAGKVVYKLQAYYPGGKSLTYLKGKEEILSDEVRDNLVNDFDVKTETIKFINGSATFEMILPYDFKTRYIPLKFEKNDGFQDIVVRMRFGGYRFRLASRVLNNVVFVKPQDALVAVNDSDKLFVQRLGLKRRLDQNQMIAEKSIDVDSIYNSAKEELKVDSAVASDEDIKNNVVAYRDEDIESQAEFLSVNTDIDNLLGINDALAQQDSLGEGGLGDKKVVNPEVVDSPFTSNLAAVEGEEEALEADSWGFQDEEDSTLGREESRISTAQNTELKSPNLPPIESSEGSDKNELAAVEDSELLDSSEQGGRGLASEPQVSFADASSTTSSQKNVGIQNLESENLSFEDNSSALQAQEEKTLVLEDSEKDSTGEEGLESLENDPIEDNNSDSKNLFGNLSKDPALENTEESLSDISSEELGLDSEVTENSDKNSFEEVGSENLDLASNFDEDSSQDVDSEDLDFSGDWNEDAPDKDFVEEVREDNSSDQSEKIASESTGSPKDKSQNDIVKKSLNSKKLKSKSKKIDKTKSQSWDVASKGNSEDPPEFDEFDEFEEENGEDFGPQGSENKAELEDTQGTVFESDDQSTYPKSKKSPKKVTHHDNSEEQTEDETSSVKSDEIFGFIIENWIGPNQKSSLVLKPERIRFKRNISSIPTGVNNFVELFSPNLKIEKPSPKSSDFDDLFGDGEL